MKGYFDADRYRTDRDTPRYLGDKMMLGGRWYFLIRFIALVFKSRSLALQGKFDTRTWGAISNEIFRLIENCGGRFDISGLENIENCQGPVVFVGNHMSILETMILPGIIAPVKEVTFVVKDSLVRHPVFGPVMRARNPIVVNRKDSREDFKTVMTEGEELLANGISVLIFPQSTRSVDFIPEDFNTLGVKLARSAHVQVIPFALKTNFWGNGKYLKDLGPIERSRPIYMSFAKPLRVSGTGKDENKQIIEFISAHLAEWRD